MRHFATWAITVGIFAGTAATATAAPIVDFFIDFNDTPVVDLFNDPDNSTQTTPIGANAHIIGIGWDLEISALNPSFLSDTTMSFSSNTAFEVQVRPAVGDDFPGTDNYSSGGVVDLIGLGLDFTLGPDGILYTQLFESFDDFPNAADGFWTGRVTVRAELQETVAPEPVTGILLALGAAGLGFRARRRHPSVS
ncbi:MAG: PEP-CTERM sorting domain-containing protein [Acidobacteria bacterium]|nr:PEP-CTERM sorting domain-containing protein [Acidobacteriota bacterium]